MNKILNQIGIKTKLNKKNCSIKIYGNPNINLEKSYKIATYLYDKLRIIVNKNHSLDLIKE